MVTFEYCSLHYLNMWLSEDRLLIEGLKSDNKCEQLDALKKAAASYRIARNLPLAGDIDKGLERYEPVLEILNQIENPVEESNIIEKIVETQERIFKAYQVQALSLTTKFMWFKFQNPVLIYDSQVRNALKADNGNYKNFYDKWKTSYDKKLREIKLACSALHKIRDYTSNPNIATEEKIEEISRERWFMERVFGIYLWNKGKFSK